jgi:ADP-ribose pyrophosphatase YjhB (NUDIX family)
MRYGISAGVIVLNELDQILLVHHQEKDKFDFWVPPGGRLEGNESIYDCARRELMEETGLQAELGQVLYIQEFWEPEYHFVKFFIYGNVDGRSLTTQNKDTDENFLVDARYFSQHEMQDLNVFPEILKIQFWQDRKNGNLATRYLGLEPLKF